MEDYERVENTMKYYKRVQEYKSTRVQNTMKDYGKLQMTTKDYKRLQENRKDCRELVYANLFFNVIHLIPKWPLIYAHTNWALVASFKLKYSFDFWA